MFTNGANGGTPEDRATIFLRPVSLPNQSALAGSVVPVRQATSDQLFPTARHQNPGSLRSSRICCATSSACGGSTMGYRRPSVVAATRNEPSGGVGMLARRLVYARAFVPAGSIFVVTLVGNREALFPPDRIHLRRGVFSLRVGGTEGAVVTARFVEDWSLCLRPSDDLGVLSRVPLPRPSPD